MTECWIERPSLTTGQVILTRIPEDIPTPDGWAPLGEAVGVTR